MAANIQAHLRMEVLQGLQQWLHDILHYMGL